MGGESTERMTENSCLGRSQVRGFAGKVKYSVELSMAEISLVAVSFWTILASVLPRRL